MLYFEVSISELEFVNTLKLKGLILIVSIKIVSFLTENNFK